MPRVSNSEDKGADEIGRHATRAAVADIGRNDPCPCGSGRRFKLCHGRIEAQTRKVDFVVAGTQKGGTSALDTYLREHPSICLPTTIKEVHHFDNDANFAGGGDGGDDTAYHSYFDPLRTHLVIGEVTPVYMYWRPVPARIHRYNPAMKVIVLLRQPALRAYSHWTMEVRKGREALSFEDALAREHERLDAVPGGQLKRVSYVDRGRYSKQLERLWEYFPREQTLVLQTRALQLDIAATLAMIAAFLGVAPFAAMIPRSVNETAYNASMSSAAARFLQNSFATEIDALERLLGWDLADWREGMAS